MKKGANKAAIAADKKLDKKLTPAQLKADIAADKKLLKAKTKK